MKLPVVTLLLLASGATSVAVVPATESQVASLVVCAESGTLRADLRALSNVSGELNYYASGWRSGDQRDVTAVMVVGSVHALLLEAVVSPTRIAIVNVASAGMKDGEWQLQETQGGPALAKEVRSLITKLTKGTKRTLGKFPLIAARQTCTGVTIP